MTSKIRSKSQIKMGFDIDPNQVSTNFNKKNQIGFKLKLLENIRNTKKNISIRDSNIEDQNSCLTDNEDNIMNLKSANDQKTDNLKLPKRNFSSKKNDVNNLTEILNTKFVREKSVSSKNCVKPLTLEYTINKDKIRNKINHSETANLKQKASVKISLFKEDKSDNKSSIDINNDSDFIEVNKTNNFEVNNKNPLSLKLMSKLEIEKFIDINTDLSSLINKKYNLDEEARVFEAWIDFENSFIDGKMIDTFLKKVIINYNNHINDEKNIFLNEHANSSFYKLIKLIILISTASLYIFNYIGFDVNVKVHLKKLCNSVSKSLSHFFEIFNTKYLFTNSLPDPIIIKIKKLTKSYKLQKNLVKNPNILIYINKEVENIIFYLKQLVK